MFVFQIPFELIQIFGYVSIDTCWTLLGVSVCQSAYRLRIHTMKKIRSSRSQMSTKLQTTNYGLNICNQFLMHFELLLVLFFGSGLEDMANTFAFGPAFSPVGPSGGRGWVSEVALRMILAAS